MSLQSGNFMLSLCVFLEATGTHVKALRLGNSVLNYKTDRSHPLPPKGAVA
jgi:hypothetical protein